MIDPKDAFKYYSRPEVQAAILDCAKDREVGIRYGDGGFGKRPDILQFRGDVCEFAKKGVTSFHISEERWNDPLQLSVGMTKRQLDELRKGWDLILDIDTKFWDYAKYTAYLLIEALKFHNINCIGVKFSGSKGMHICVPFEAFPDKVNGVMTKDLFPDSLRVIAAYLSQMIRDMLATEILSHEDIDSLALKDGKRREDLLENGRFNPFSIIDIDTVLISSRHMFRAPYSLHEKSGLVSMPIDVKDVMKFEKDSAKPENINFSHKFIDKDKIVPNEAKDLIIQAFDWHSKQAIKREESRPPSKDERKFDAPTAAIPADHFPPCILNILKGNMEDGKKRSLFVLIKFLSHMGWSREDIDKCIHDWNSKNPQPLRENSLAEQLKYHTARKDNIMAPNCANTMYKELRICTPDNLCSRIKNPINYSMRRAWAFAKNAPKRKKSSAK